MSLNARVRRLERQVGPREPQLSAEVWDRMRSGTATAEEKELGAKWLGQNVGKLAPEEFDNCAVALGWFTPEDLLL